jgi:hypothetical protein
LLDNFSGHFIDFEPCNIWLMYFQPNLTLHVQPLDAGIIHCFKAHYHCAFCLCAIELAEELDIYEINLLEVVTMVKEAWDAVSTDMIQNCWSHAGIQL